MNFRMRILTHHLGTCNIIWIILFLVVEPVTVVKEKVVEAEDQSITKKELEEVEEVLEQVAEERMSMKIEQDELEALKEDVSEYKEVGKEMKLSTVGIT